MKTYKLDRPKRFYHASLNKDYKVGFQLHAEPFLFVSSEPFPHWTIYTSRNDIHRYFMYEVEVGGKVIYNYDNDEWIVKGFITIIKRLGRVGKSPKSGNRMGGYSFPIKKQGAIMGEGYWVSGWDESQRKRAEDYYYYVRTNPIVVKEDDFEKIKLYSKLNIPVKIKTDKTLVKEI